MIKEDASFASRRASSIYKKGMFLNVDKAFLWTYRACVRIDRCEKYWHKSM